MRQLNLLASALLFPFLAQAQVPYPTDSLLRTGTLKNGLTYYIRPNSEPEDRAELRLIVRAGSLQEDEDQRGIAHFIEHMAFNGTEHFAENDLIDFLESTGMRFGPDINAYTGFAETGYRLQVRTDSAGLLDKGLLILEDWAGGLSFSPEEMDKERGVVISEWRTRLSPGQRQRRKIFPVLYRGARYTERLPIGDPDLIRDVPYDVIERYYTDWYRPDLMAVIAVGDFDPEAMEAEIKKRFSDLENPKEVRPRQQYTVPAFEKLEFVQATDPEAAFTQVELYLQQPGLSNDSVDFRRELRRTLVNRMLGARLLELQRQADPPFTFATSAFSGSLGKREVYLLSAFTSPEKIKQGFRAVLETTMQAREHGFLASELERKKDELLSRYEKAAREQENTKSRVYANRIIAHFLRGAPLLTDRQRYERHRMILAEITLDEVNALLPKWWSALGGTLVVTAPEKAAKTLPDETTWRKLLEEIRRKEYAPYKEAMSKAPLFQEELAPQSIVGRKYFEDFDLYEYHLANGVRVVVKPTDFKEDEIRMGAFSSGGHSSYTDADYFNASLAASIVRESGLGAFSATELMKKLTGKQVSVSPYISELYEGFNGNSSTDDLELLFQLIYLYFTDARLDKAALESFKSRQRPILENMMADPYYYFGEASLRIRCENHPRRGILSVDDLGQLDADRMKAIYTDRFADASDFTFVFTGNIDLEIFPRLLATYLGNLPSTNRKESWKDVGVRLVPGVVDSTLVKGQAPKALVEVYFHGDFTYRSQYRYDYSSMIEVLRIRLRERLREDLGGVYGVRVNDFIRQDPVATYRTSIRFTCAPGDLDTLIYTLYDEIRSLQEFPVDDSYITKVQETQRHSFLESQRDNRFWHGQLLSRYRKNIPLVGLKEPVYFSYVDGLSSKTVMSAAQRYFDWGNRIQLVLLPELEK